MAASSLPTQPESTPIITPAPAPTPTPAPAPVSEPLPPKRAFEVLVKVNVKHKAGSRKKAKTDKSPQFGPAVADTHLTWTDFLDVLAREMRIQRERIVVASLTWRWMKPATAAVLPLSSENGYRSMLKQILGSKAESPYIFVFMDPLAPKITSRVSSLLLCMCAFISNLLVQELLSSDDERQQSDHSPVRKSTTARGRLDANLRSVQDDLKTRYFNACKEHQDESCFHSRPTNQHFILDREKLLVWANCIVCQLLVLLSFHSNQAVPIRFMELQQRQDHHCILITFNLTRLHQLARSCPRPLHRVLTIKVLSMLHRSHLLLAQEQQLPLMRRPSLLRQLLTLTLLGDFKFRLILIHRR